MEIRREIEGKEVVVTLTDAELMAAYQEKKQELDRLEVIDNLARFERVELIEKCGFPYPAYQNFDEAQLEQIEGAIYENEELLADIYKQYEEYDEGDYQKAMDTAISKVLKEWGQNNPEFLKQFENIKQKAYEKYKADWLKERKYSEEFLAELFAEYTEEFREWGNPSSFEEYIETYGYHGELYVCFEEFLGAEYQDMEYMKGLLDEAEFAEYQKDVKGHEGFHKEYADYGELRSSLQNGTYDILMDSIGQLNAEGYSTDVTIRDYDGVLCIDYDVYEKKDSGSKHLDGGKVCEVSQMPEKEEDFIGVLKEAVQSHLKEKEEKTSLNQKMMDAEKRVGRQGDSRKTDGLER